MGLSYKLTCSCGAEHPVELSQAGRTIVCSCGRELAIPSLLKLKRLPLWEGEAAESDSSSLQAADSQPAVQKVSSSKKKKDSRSHSSLLQSRKRGLLIVGAAGAVFFLLLLIRTLTSPPQLIDVLRIQRSYVVDEKVINRDSNPIEKTDVFFFVTNDAEPIVIDNGIIDQMTPFYAVEYFDYLKTGLDLSDNFYDKLESLHVRWKLTIGLESLLAFFFLAAAAASFVLRGEKTVGVQRGTAWKS